MNAVAHRIEPQNTVVMSGAASLMLIIERAVLDPNFDPQKLRELFSVKKEWDAEEARKSFVSDMAAFKADPPAILKDKHVSYKRKDGGITEYDHATLGQICTDIAKGLGEHHISHRWDVVQKEGLIKVTCVLTHAAGHSESVSMFSGADDSGGKNSIQAIASAVTYLQRYTLLSATGLAAMDTDDDGAASDDIVRITADQAANVRALMDEVKADEPRFLSYLKIESIEKIPAHALKDAIAALESKRRK